MELRTAINKSEGTMIQDIFKRLRRRRRKYPIKKDESGKSARYRAFQCFGLGMKPAETALEVGISTRTARRYYADFKKIKWEDRFECKLTKNALRNNQAYAEALIECWSLKLGMSKEEVLERLEKPWGLQQLLAGKWPNYARERRRKEAEADLHAGLKFVKFMRILGFTRERVDEMIEEYIKEALRRKAIRERKDPNTLRPRPGAPSELENGDVRP